MDSNDVHKRLMAAYALLSEETTTRDKFNHISTMIRGIHKRIDIALDNAHQALSSIDKMRDGDIIGLSADHLPENTEEEKRRKKYLLFFIRSWNDLKSEVARVQGEFNNNQGQSGATQTSMWGRILRGAKGPLGVITVLAIGVVALQQTAVTISIENRGCPTLYPSGSSVSLPGFKMPKDPITSGGGATMTVPPLIVHIDGTKKGAITITSLKYSFTFEIPSGVTDVLFDGASIVRKKTDVHLSDRDNHNLLIQCI